MKKKPADGLDRAVHLGGLNGNDFFENGQKPGEKQDDCQGTGEKVALWKAREEGSVGGADSLKHDDKKKEHEDRARVNNQVDHGNERGPKQKVKHGQAEHGDDEGEQGARGPGSENYGKGAQNGDPRRQIKKKQSHGK